MQDTSTTPSKAVGRTVTFLLAPSGSLVALGPAWAVLCGAWAAGNWRWESNTLLALLLVVFIAEVLWSTWRAQVVDMDWANYVAAHPLPARGVPVPRLPYTTPWSPLGHLLKRWGQVRRWMNETLPVERRGALLALPILPPLILLLSAVVGWQMLILSLAALSLSLIEWRVARRGQMHSALQAGLEIGLSWLAGHIVIGSLTWVSFTLACCYALAYQGALSFDRDHRPWSLALLCGGQVAASIALLLQGYPLAARTGFAATTMGLLLVPQLLLLARSETDDQGIWYLRRAVPFLVIAMPIAAWAV